MNRRKWNPNRPYTPSASVPAGTRHCRTRGHAGMLPITSARPVSKKGGTCRNETPSVASVAHKTIAPSAKRFARNLRDARGVGLLVGVVTRSHHRADGRMREAHLVRLRFEHLEGVGVHIAAHGQVR